MTELEALDVVASDLAGSVTGRVSRDYPLAGVTTYRLGGPAALLVEPAGASDLVALGRALQTVRSNRRDLPLLTLGRGSNVVISDQGFPGVVIRMGPSLARLEGEDNRVTAGAAAPLPQAANWAARRGLSGLEFAVAIPGSVGGGVRMNAGAHGRSIADCLIAARVFDLDDLELQQRSRASLGFAYRRSNLTERHLVVDATFSLEAGDGDEIRALMASFRRHRSDTQPGAAQNAGSVFKNPPGDTAGRLIESTGLKGARCGGVAVSQLHANFFVASAGARAQDVFDLVAFVRARVLDATGVDLEPEIRFVGAFEPAPGACEGTPAEARSAQGTAP